MLGVKAMKELGPHRAAGHPHRERVGHRAGGVPRGGVGGGLGPGRGGHGHRLRQDDRDGQRERPSRGTGRDQLDATILPAAYFALWAQRRMHDYGTTPRDLRRHRRQELEPRRALPVERPAARPHRHRRGGAGVADGVRAAHRDDGVPGRRRRRLRDPRLHRVGEAPPPRPPAGAPGGVGPPQRDLLARPHLPRTGRRPGDDDARHRAARLRGRRARPRGHATWRCATTPSPTRSSSTTSCSASAPTARATSSSPRAPPRSAGGSPSTPTAASSPAATPAGPTGLAMVHEVVQQLRGEAGKRQVEGARTALAHLVGGGSVCTVSLFEAD